MPCTSHCSECQEHNTQFRVRIISSKSLRNRRTNQQHSLIFIGKSRKLNFSEGSNRELNPMPPCGCKTPHNTHFIGRVSFLRWRTQIRRTCRLDPVLDPRIPTWSTSACSLPRHKDSGAHLQQRGKCHPRHHRRPGCSSKSGFSNLFKRRCCPQPILHRPKFR